MALWFPKSPVARPPLGRPLLRGNHFRKDESRHRPVSSCATNAPLDAACAFPSVGKAERDSASKLWAQR